MRTTRAQHKRGAPRRPRLRLIGTLAASAIGAALWFALTGPDTRAGAITGALSALASTAAALTALYLSREALARTDRQLINAQRATVLSRYPLLLPVHQSVAFPDSTGNLAAHPPTQERFKLAPPNSGSYAFLADTSDRFVIPVENAGEGPALQVTGDLWRNDGRRGELIGPTALGAGKVAVMTARLGVDVQKLPAQFAEAVAAISGPDSSAGSQVFYWLELSYIDVFSNRLSAWALFDTRGLGAWRHVTGPMIEATTPSLRSQ